MAKKRIIKLSVLLSLTLYPLSLALLLPGCAPAQISGYISRADHPYDRKIDASFERVVSSTVYVLKKQGWTIDGGVDPSTYERDDRYDNNGYRNLLIMTGVRKHFLTSAHLNIFIHSIGDTCDVEIRWEAHGSWIKQFTTVRNDRLVEGILDAIEKDLSS